MRIFSCCVVVFILFFIVEQSIAKMCCDYGDILIEPDTTMCLQESKKYTYNVSILKKCDWIATIKIDDQYNFTEQENRLLIWRYLDKENKFRTMGSQLSEPDYCIGSVKNEENITTEAAAICVQIVRNPIEHMTPYCMVLSVIFLIVTVIIYGSIRELRDLQGKSIISLCGSFAISLSLIATMNLDYAPYENMAACAAIGFLAYFFTIASFFWMNSIAVQVLLSTRLTGKPLNSKDWKDYIYYAIYSWSCSAILTVCAIVANHVPAGQAAPGFGYTTCWFSGISEQWLYLYSVLSILIILNCAIFLYTSIYFCRNTFHSNRVKALKFGFQLNLRLFVIMGISWIFEIASSINEQSHMIWFILDLVNALQGLLIFLILIFRPRAMKEMNKRGWFFCLGNIVEKYLGQAEDEEINVVHQNIDTTIQIP